MKILVIIDDDIVTRAAIDVVGPCTTVDGVVTTTCDNGTCGIVCIV